MLIHKLRTIAFESEIYDERLLNKVKTNLTKNIGEVNMGAAMIG